MPSLISGFEYDIFISYRQKDNKHDGWVTEFVDNLKGELESTFKEEISLYFDINPHDGLLETHDVDESLKEKLRCLVFIPIISRTYCDPKSFAWEHEFKAFVELASHDQFGLKVKLPSGNVTARILPIQIHDLHPEDRFLLERELGGFLRGVEFTYKEPGVNRPLRPDDDDKINLNKTKYRNQINKVANAMDEILNGLTKVQTIPLAEKKVENTSSVDIISQVRKLSTTQISGDKASVYEERFTDKAIRFKKKGVIYIFSSFVVIMVVTSLFIFSSGSILPFTKRDWIIITDFENFTENPVFDKSLYTAFSLSASQSRYINVFPRSRMLETLARMEIKDRTIVDEKTGREVAIREGIALYIVPSISESGMSYAIATKIMEAKSGNLLKSLIIYVETKDKILSGLDQVSKIIRHDLGESRYDITRQDKPLAKVTTSSLEALNLYSLGIDRLTLADFTNARDYFERALQIDTGFTAARASLGNLNIEKFDLKKGRDLLSEAVKSVDNLTEREKLGILAFNAARVENDLPKAIEYTKRRIDLYPDDPSSYNNLGWYYWNSGELEKAVKEYKEAIRIDPHLTLCYGSLLWIYLEYLGDADSALVWSKKMLSDNPQNAWSYANLGSSWLCLDSISKAEEAYIEAYKINPDLIENLYNIANTYRLKKEYNKAVSSLKRILEINRSEVDVYYDLGVNYQYMGNSEEAKKYFKGFKTFITEKLTKELPNPVGEYISLAAVLARLGDKDSSKQMLKKAIKIDSTLHDRFANIFCLHGEIPEALNELDKSFANGYRNLYDLKASPDLQTLQYDIRFRDLLKKYFK